MYMRLALLLVCLVVVSTVFYALGSDVSCFSYEKCGFFINYECGERKISYILLSIMIQDWLWFIQAATLAMLSMLLRMITNYSLTDFLNAGRLGHVLGFGVKYMPWIVLLLNFFWLVLMSFTLVLLAMVGICSLRYNPRGIAAVKNCRLYYNSWEFESSPDTCHISQSHGEAAIWSCNSLEFLINERFAVLDCELNTKYHVCDVFKGIHDAGASWMPLAEAYELIDPAEYCATERPPSYDPDYLFNEHLARGSLWKRFLGDSDLPASPTVNVPPVNATLANSVRPSVTLDISLLSPNASTLSKASKKLTPEENSKRSDNTMPDEWWLVVGARSDLYRYALLWCGASCFVVATATLVTVMVRFNSPVESSFYTPKEEGDFWCVLFLKELSPWNTQ